MFYAQSSLSAAAAAAAAPAASAEFAPSSEAARRRRAGLIGFFLENLVTPQAVVRTLGPMGRGFVRNVVAARFFAMAPAERELYADYLFHVAAASGSTEFALNVLMTLVTEPREATGIYALHPLLPRLHAARGNARPARVRVLFGERDWMARSVRPADVAAMRAADVDYAVLPRAGHHLYLDQPAGFVNALL